MKKEILITLLKVAGVAVLALLLYYALWMVLDRELRYFWPFSWVEMLIDFSLCLTISLVVSIFYWRSHMRIQRERDKFKLRSLENQINPHFVFNNFSTLSELIEESPERAQAFLMNLSKVYRYNLSSLEKPLVPIADELSNLDQYIDIMHSRFGDSFELSISDDARSQEGNIAPCSLQMLVENALKHNEHTQKHPLKITIKTDGSRICVSNEKQPLANDPTSTNLGNQNLQERYSLLSHEDIHIENTIGKYSVSLPIL